MKRLFRTDLKTHELRDVFLEGLSRISLALGIGHFLCLPPLYLRFGGIHSAYMLTLAAGGAAFLAIAFLCRYPRIQRLLPYFSLGVLISQTTYFLTWEPTLYRPTLMVFPLLCALATPILSSPRASYGVASLSSAIVLAFHFFYFRLGWGQMPALCMYHVVLYFSAFLAENLWTRIRSRELALEAALTELRKRNKEMESWVERLGHASSLISTGHVATTLPGPAPYHVFDELTQSMGQMQEKLNQYFTNLFLQDRLNSLGVLASGVAHELNTPLTSMHFLVNGSDNIPAETKAALIQEIERMTTIAKGLLSFARLHDEELTDLNEIVRACVPLLQKSQTEGPKLDLNLCDAALPIRALSNEIQQILINLVLNAKDALEGRPRPQIEISTSQEKDRAAILQITDNGAGIEKENLAKIMNPFFTTKPPGKGTGLGLYIVHQIAQRHGALLSIESQVGKGTSIKLTFPLVPRSERKVA